MHNEDKLQNGFKTIKPAPLGQTAERANTSSKSSNIKSKTLVTVLSIAIVTLSAIFVIVFLPDWIENKRTSVAEQEDSNATSAKIATEQEQLAADTVIAEKNTQKKTPAITNKPTTKPETIQSTQISPWEQAQQKEFRKKAQSFLQDLLEKQKVLQENNAEIWAKEIYETALSHSQEGDKAYNQGKFDIASDTYQQALGVVNTIVEQIDAVYNENILQGQQALENGDTKTAIAAFTTAALFNNDSGQAPHGLERTNKLDEVFTLIAQGDQAYDSNQLIKAKEAYQTALKLDPETSIAKQKLQQTQKLLAEKQFNQHMTTGFAALDQQQFNAARNEFNKALKIKPNASDAKAALQQVKHQATTVKIAAILNDASQAEAQEQWPNAITLYEQALRLEGNLTEAQEGKQRANIELRRFEQLQTILSKPERLSDKSVHRETQAYYTKVSAIENPKPILAQQIESLENLLKVSATPIAVQFESDGLTKVTLLKVKKMGAFDSQVLSLRPGKYVTVGHRDGYRDVRVEFYVSADESNKIVRIAANKKI